MVFPDVFVFSKVKTHGYFKLILEKFQSLNTSALVSSLESKGCFLRLTFCFSMSEQICLLIAASVSRAQSSGHESLDE